jgi:hypothetical protein
MPALNRSGPCSGSSPHCGLSTRVPTCSASVAQRHPVPFCRLPGPLGSGWRTRSRHWTYTEASSPEADGCQRGLSVRKWPNGQCPLCRISNPEADRPLSAKIAHSVSRPSSIADHRLSDYAPRKRVCRPSVPGRTPVASGWLELASTCSPSQACLIARGSKRLLLARGHERFVVCCAAGQVTGRSPSLAFVYGSFRPVHVMGNRT